MSDHHPHEHHGPSLNVYLTIFGCLAVLTVLTVAVSRLNLNPAAAVVVAIAIAISKASLVVAFFMHLKYVVARTLYLMCVVPTVLTVLLLIALLPDVGMAEPGVAGAPGAHPPEAAEVVEEVLH
jgi:cytochrome c oxidase subunit 4